MGSPSAQFHFFNRAAASPARFAFPAVYGQLPLKPAGIPLGIRIGTDGAAAFFHGFPKGGQDRFMKPLDAFGRQAGSGRGGMDGCPEQGFVRVNIPDSRHHPLIEQHRFDRPRSLLQLFVQISGGERFGKGLRTETGQGHPIPFGPDRENMHRAEFPDVPVTQLFPVAESQNDMGMLIHGFVPLEQAVFSFHP